MKNISFFITTPQIRAKTKTVTRRLGWRNLKAGTLLQACVKCQGLKPWEPIEKLGVIRVVSARRERLDHIDYTDCVAEGFPDYGPLAFASMFCAAMGCEPWTEVTRIEFEYI